MTKDGKHINVYYGKHRKTNTALRSKNFHALKWWSNPEVNFIGNPEKKKTHYMNEAMPLAARSRELLIMSSKQAFGKNRTKRSQLEASMAHSVHRKRAC